ncbi:putative defense protein 1 [Patiria miniata]|uniref:Reelin domain-containing protein n=1 Tax=Patiria miniata TaxID=46514 RepID=A0A914AHD5_PATMI|nr:putative defense protein 1 [Patiria miniata]
MMKYEALVFTVSALVVLGVADAFPDGASPRACVDMVPGHSSTTEPGRVISPQESISPYSVVARGDGYTPGGTVSVSILAEPSNITFQGFLLQARTLTSLDPVGTFLAGTDGASRLLTCNVTGDSITHTGPGVKRSGMTLTWQAPTESVGNIRFLLSVARNHDVYWVRMESNTLSASASLSAVTMPILVFLLGVTMATSN